MEEPKVPQSFRTRKNLGHSIHEDFFLQNSNAFFWIQDVFLGKYREFNSEFAALEVFIKNRLFAMDTKIFSTLKVSLPSKTTQNKEFRAPILCRISRWKLLAAGCGMHTCLSSPVHNPCHNGNSSGSFFHRQPQPPSPPDFTSTCTPGSFDWKGLLLEASSEHGFWDTRWLPSGHGRGSHAEMHLQSLSCCW